MRHTHCYTFDLAVMAGRTKQDNISAINMLQVIKHWQIITWYCFFWHFWIQIYRVSTIHRLPRSCYADKLWKKLYRPVNIHSTRQITFSDSADVKQSVTFTQTDLNLWTIYKDVLVPYTNTGTTLIWEYQPYNQHLSNDLDFKRLSSW